jgi:DNA repair exonuclease SbcCD ATPase subunit
MKSLLQNLLILFAFGLCVLLVVQWHREGVLREQLERSNSTTLSLTETNKTLQSDVRRLQANIARIEGLRQQQSASAAAREREVARLTADLTQYEQQAAELESFKTALAKANENIKGQNETLKQQTEGRNEIAARFNHLAEEYNALVKRSNEQQAALTNTPRVTP